MSSRHSDSPVPTRRPASVDAIVLSLSFLAAIVHPLDASSTLIAVAATFLVGAYWAVSIFGRTADAEYKARAFRVQLAIVLGLIGLLVVLPTLVAIGNRHDTAPYRDIHDSALQIELATGMLLHGHDYYRATYFHTPLAQWWPVGPPNPALYHTDSLPFQEELTAPFMLASKATLGWFDERFIYLLCLVAVAGLALWLARTPTSRLALLGGLCLNPLFMPSFIAGQNDVLVLAEVMGVLALARAGRRRSSLVLLGIALATKETALFLLPFLLLWMAGLDWRSHSYRNGSAVTEIARGRKSRLAWAVAWLARYLPWVALPLAISVGPFVVWDARALWDSTIGFVEGTVAHPFPIRGLEGYGFASFVLFGHLVRSAQAYWPFGIVQVLIAGPVALVLLRRQWRDNSLSRVVAGCATTLFFVYYFGRFFHGSFVAFTLSLVLLGYFLDPNARTHLSLDFLLLLIVVPQSLARPDTPTLAIIAAITMGALILYALVDCAADGWNTIATPRSSGRNWRLRVGLTLVMLGIIVVWPETYGIAARHSARPWNYIHDTPIQAEEAISYLLSGRNFYAQSYANTPLAHWYSSPAMAATLYHVDRPPLSILASVPFYVLFRAVMGWFDERFVLLLALGACVVLLLRIPASRELRLCAVVAALLNPFFVPTLVYGQDDVLVLALLLACGTALYRRRFGWAAAWLGLACATKHTALFMLPPYFMYAIARHHESTNWYKRCRLVVRETWPALVVPALICAPFLLWNARAFIDGNVGFLAGTVEHSYPIRGIGTYGFSAVVLLKHVARSANAYYPFAVWEAAITLPLLVLGGRRLGRAPTVQQTFALFALVLFVGYFFSRFFQDSGLAFAISALVLGALLPVDVKRLVPARKRLSESDAAAA